MPREVDFCREEHSFGGTRESGGHAPAASAAKFRRNNRKVERAVPKLNPYGTAIFNCPSTRLEFRTPHRPAGLTFSASLR